MSFSYSAGYMTNATSTAADDSTTANYNYTYTLTGNVQTEQINLAAMSKDVTLAADYDYNNSLTTLAANIGGDYAEFDYSTETGLPTGKFTGFYGGVNDFINSYTVSVRPTPQGFTRAYRAVSEAEYQQILSTGKFEVGPNSMEGKWFADSLEGAHAHGNALEGPGNYRLIEADLPDNAPSLFRQPNLDGRGPARYLHIDDLNNVQPRPAGGQ